MTNLKLAKLPDRTPVRITVTVSADLNQALCDYQKLYAATYGVSEKVADLIPFMLEAFLESDRAFAKARRDGIAEAKTDGAGGQNDSGKPRHRAPLSRAGEAETATAMVSMTSSMTKD